MGAHSCDLSTEAMDSDNDSTDDDQASADVGAVTVNATDATGVSGSAARTSPYAGAMRPYDYTKHVFITWNVLEVVVLSAVRTSTQFYDCFYILR